MIDFDFDFDCVSVMLAISALQVEVDRRAASSFLLCPPTMRRWLAMVRTHYRCDCLCLAADDDCCRDQEDFRYLN